LLLQFFVKLRREQSQEFSIASHEFALGVGGAKHNCVARAPTKDGATEVALHRFHVRAGLHELDSKRRQPRSCAVARDRKHPCERAFDQYRRLNFIREKPAKLNAPFFVVLLLDDLLGTGELFVARHLVDRRTEILGRESSKPDGVKTLSAILCSEQKAHRRVCADLTNRAPEGK